jgi:hypothetical protein
MLNAPRNISRQHALRLVIYSLRMHIGDRITQRLTKLGEKPSTLARAAGLSRSAISQRQDGPDLSVKTISIEQSPPNPRHFVLFC